MESNWLSDMKPADVQELLERGEAGAEFELYEDRAVNQSIDIKARLEYPKIKGEARHAVLIDVGDEVRDGVIDDYERSFLENCIGDLGTWKVYNWRNECAQYETFFVCSDVCQAPITNSLSGEVERFSRQSIISSSDSYSREYSWLRNEDIPGELRDDYSNAYSLNNKVNDGERDILS